ETTECSPEGYDFGGPGLLWESLTDRFVFGDKGEPTLEDLREYIEAMLSLAGVSECKPDLDHLLRKEQHLERAYRKLLEHVQQHARESAVETPEIAVLKTEVLITGQSSANFCPAPTVASAFLREEVVGLSPTTLTGTCDFLPAASMELEQTSPAEDLVTEQRVQDLCPTLLAILETGDLIDISVEENAPSKPPAEVLAIGQRVQDLCPTPAAILEAQGEEVAVYRKLQIRIQGENAVITSQLQLDLVSVDETSVSTCIPQGCWAVGPDAQQHEGLSPATLSSLLRLKGLQGEGPVCTSPQQQRCSMTEAEVGWVSNALFGTICLGYCVGTGITGLELWTNFGVNPSGVSSCVSLLQKGEK
ncbi:hypothetical protein AB205_0157880, partial [Aquarana catesbeiana]